MAIDLTGINNVGEFYSHHYLDALLDKDLKGLFSSWKKEDDQTPDKRLNGCATEYFRAKSQAMRMRRMEERYEASHRLHAQLLEALGYPYEFGVQYLNTGEVVPVLSAVTRSGAPHLWLLETVFSDPDDSPLDNLPFKEQYPAHEEEAGDSRPQAPWEDVIGEIFRTDQPPRWLIFFAGRFVYLIDRTKWGQGQYLLFDLDEIFGVRKADTVRATAALLSQEGLAPEDGVAIHDTLDENSHKHAYGVSSDLKYGVRKAVELLANEYIWYQRNIGKKALFTDENLAGELTRECLRYLYRLLFLFYAEARSSELGLVPMRSEAYRAGYSLEALRDLEQVPLNTPQAQDGYYLNDSLNQLYKLINEGYPEIIRQMGLEESGQPVYDDYGFTVTGLQSPLFEANSTPRLSSAKFRNSVLQEILQQLSLSQEKKGKKAQRGRISYAQLGINQLGAVYEGLLSYSGFFAQERLYVVKRAQDDANNESTQFYYIPERELEKFKSDEFVYVEGPEGMRRRQYYEPGSFIFRLAGRDREKSASYYTPEVLTECVVKYSLKELLGQSPEDENWKTADEILKLTLCEPAMGSGAFINEAINQLADAYLARKQAETGETIAIDDYLEERQKVKAHLALNNAYGVDLNPMAVELAQISIWLNTIFPGMPAPWFNARMAVGNSLIGARRQVYSAEDVKSGAYAKQAPEAVRVGEPRPTGSIYHWLLPEAGMAAFDKDKVIKELAPADVQAIKDWRKEFTAKFKAEEIRQLQQLSDWADGLWEQVVRDRQRLLAETKEELDLWGQEKPVEKARLEVADKERMLRHFERPNGPYRRLKLAMDYWCALWFWPIPEAKKLPVRGDFLADMAAVLKGADKEVEGPARQLSLLEETKQAYQEKIQLPVVDVEKLVPENERLGIIEAVQSEIRFQHWELVFAELFDGRGGFDLIVGNPPWVKTSFDEAGVLSDFDPQISLRKMSAAKVTKLRRFMLPNSVVRNSYSSEFCEQTGSKEYLGANMNFPLLTGKANLYKCFVTRSWEFGSENGIVGLLHPEGVYDDPNGGELREQIYPRLKVHFQFLNELKLFAEVMNNKKYSVNIYRTTAQDFPEFYNISNLFHPATIEYCFNHDGLGSVPAMKTDDNQWELKGHSHRLTLIDQELLATFADLYDDGFMDALQARLPMIFSIEIAEILKKLSRQEHRLGDYSDSFFATQFWNETNSQKDGTIRRDTKFPPNTSEWIVSGAHLFVANLYYQTPNENCKSRRDLSKNDLTKISDDFLPRTNYVRNCTKEEFESRMPKWNSHLLTTEYRQFFRAMLGPGTSERVLIGCIAPPELTHINGVKSYTFEDVELMVKFSGLSSSIIFDFFIRSTGRQNLHELPNLLPIPDTTDLVNSMITSRTLRLNCLTKDYSEIWKKMFSIHFNYDDWSNNDDRLSSPLRLTADWHWDTPLRNDLERRQALIELDVLTSISLDLTLEELISVYRMQSPVMRKYENQMLFDQRGMQVPIKTVRGELLVDEDHEDFPAMVPPFTPVDREADYRRAWAFFEERLAEEKDMMAS